ncbi:hypothetical protein Plhal304r1_c002g0007891 [Plasmopara halstedii]
MFDILGVALYEEAVCHLPDGKVRVKQHCAFLPASSEGEDVGARLKKSLRPC